MRSKLKNYITGGTNEMTFRAGEKLQTADVDKRAMQYTYADGDQYVFMDMESFEETRLEEGDFTKFLKEVGLADFARHVIGCRLSQEWFTNSCR